MLEYFAKSFAHNSGICHYVIRRKVVRGPFIKSQMSTRRHGLRVWITGSLEAFLPFAAEVFDGIIADPGTRDRRKVFRRINGWSAGKVHSVMPEPWHDDKALARTGYVKVNCGGRR